jgi:hypothetical protein
MGDFTEFRGVGVDLETAVNDTISQYTNYYSIDENKLEEFWKVK